MPVNKKLSNIAFKCRGLFWALFAAAAFFSRKLRTGPLCRRNADSRLGTASKILGGRLYPQIQDGKDSAPILVTWGPYRWVRNPLYAGNFIMGLGWALMLGWMWVAAFTAAFLLLYCLIVIPAEEEFLASKFGPQYLAYRERVPSLFPYPRKGLPDSSPHSQPFDRERAWSEEIYSIRMNLLVTVLISGRLYITLL